MGMASHSNHRLNRKREQLHSFEGLCSIDRLVTVGATASYNKTGYSKPGDRQRRGLMHTASHTQSSRQI